MAVKRGSKRPKVEPDIMKELYEDDEKLNRFIKTVDEELQQMKLSMIDAYRIGVEKYCKDNPAIAATKLVDFIQMQKVPKIEPKFVKVERDKDIKEEKTKPPVQKIKQDEEPQLNIPDVIRTKKSGFRLPIPHEVLFSVNGTPITVETTKRSRNVKIEATDYKQSRIKSEFSEK